MSLLLNQVGKEEGKFTTEINSCKGDERCGVQAEFLQKIYNLGLSNGRLDISDEASQAFDELLTVVPTNIFVVYYIANLY